MKRHHQDPYYNDPPEEHEPSSGELIKLVVFALIAAAVALVIRSIA